MPVNILFLHILNNDKQKVQVGHTLKKLVRKLGILWAYQNNKKIMQKWGVYEQKTPAKMLKNC